MDGLCSVGGTSSANLGRIAGARHVGSVKHSGQASHYSLFACELETGVLIVLEASDELESPREGKKRFCA